MRVIRFDDEAEQELQAAAAWERERPGFGRALLDAVAHALAR